MLSIGERLKNLRIQKGLSQGELANIMGISRGQVSKIESNVSNNITASTLASYMNVFSVSADYIMTGHGQESSLTEEEVSLVTAYRKLSELDRSRICGYIDVAIHTIQDTTKGLLKEPQPIYTYNKNNNLIPVVGSVAAGLPIDAIENISSYIDTDIPNVQFALYAKGHSMEPVILHDEMIFVRKKPEIENGEIGIFLIDGEATCKIYHNYEDRIELRSFNPNFSPMIYLKKDLTSFQIEGKVILTPTQKARIRK